MAFIMSWREDGDEADRGMARLAGFRRELHRSLGLRRDALFEACDALACGRSGCTCWRSCRWSRSAGAGTAACTMR